MGILVYWDFRSPDGIQTPVHRIISGLIGCPADLIPGDHFPLDGYHRIRRQYDASRILDRISLFKRMHAIDTPFLLVIPDDIYTESSDFVFGLARSSTGSAVVSTARLENEYYGRDEDTGLLIERIAKEGLHEIGHLFGLTHCSIPECIMFQPGTMGELDRKQKWFCPGCRSLLPTL
ncbi:archaemetzincin family Zn-dependent metalloprotease [Methanocalculus alkaliphilus]|uniref:archaemetzincin family Zn-dependent metalloprotease n=1 Tax=Methanocalculus alkaliphilus TaxID=768730 RepID=UPI0020A0B035|nr:archaemetzincin family Zn-dependent metalloprotease [Methanocalculus alkaliphilus]